MSGMNGLLSAPIRANLVNAITEAAAFAAHALENTTPATVSRTDLKTVGAVLHTALARLGVDAGELPGNVSGIVVKQIAEAVASGRALDRDSLRETLLSELDGKNVDHAIRGGGLLTSGGAY